ncbi:MAG: glycosyltransferase [Ignavibacteria bacterium]|nr:glycosyltransferase [Ignavibacteria bacterium]
MLLELLWHPYTITCCALTGMATTFLCFAVVNTRKLTRLPSSAIIPQEKISVLVPARNEARCIEACIRSLCAQNLPNLEVIVLNDQSEDNTGIILGRLAAEYSTLRVIDGTPLPDGWVGKSWACHNLSLHATGDVLVFTDADTVHQPDTLARAVASMKDNNLDMLSLIPLQTMKSFAEHAVIPIVHMIFFATMLNIRRIGKHNTTPSAAIGQFIAFTARGYSAIGGHQRVRYSLVEDVFLAKAAAHDGIAFALVDGTDAVDCHMYTSAEEVTKGFSKNLFAAMKYNPLLMIGFIVLQLALYVMPPAMLVYSIVEGRPLDAAMLLFVILATLSMRYTVAKRFSMPSWHAAIQPVTALWCIAICINSIRWAYSRNGSQWKGRAYARRET